MKPGMVHSVLALARHLELSNTTLRRHYPQIVAELGQIRRTPATALGESAAATEYSRTVGRNAKLRRDNQLLRQHLERATANIARLSIDNHQLRQQLEQAQRVTHINSRNAFD